jgi:hypothetical protein
MLCRAGLCGRAAALHVCVDKRPVAGACSRACAEQIRAQLIGMPKRAADDDDEYDDDDDRGESDRIRERRQNEAQRFRDLATLGQWIVALSNIRAKVYAMTPMEVSTATMRINGRYDDGGSALASKLDTLILRTIDLQRDIVNNNAYNIREILVGVRELRNAIADEDDLINEINNLFLSTTDVPMQSRDRSRVQRIAVFPTDPIGRNQIWAHNGRIRIEDVEYAYDGTPLEKSQYVYAPGASNATNGLAYNSFGQIIVAMEPHGLWAITPSPTTTPLSLFLRRTNTGYFHVEDGDIISHSWAPNKLFTLSIAARKKYGFVSCRFISAGSSMVGVVADLKQNNVMFVKLSIDHANAIISDVEEVYLMDRNFRNNMIALDSGGNVWAYHVTSNHVRVFNSSGQQIAMTNDMAVSSMCAAEEGVWITYVDLPTGASYCANYRLAPPASSARSILSSY